MDAPAIKSRLTALRTKIGPNADLSVRIDADQWRPADGGEVVATAYPYGITKSQPLCAQGHSFAEAISNLEALWEKHSAEHRVQTTRAIALAIIRITSELGRCTDAALRAEFDPGAVKRWGDDACKMADDMAGRGPFKIVKAAKANAA